jgi:hypothetical protein
MNNSEFLTEYAGLPVVEFPSRTTRARDLAWARRHAESEGLPLPDSLPEDPALTAALADPGSVAWRLHTQPGDGCFCFSRPCRCGKADAQTTEEYMDSFVREVDGTAVRAITAAAVMEESFVNAPAHRDLLVEYAPHWPDLGSLFFAEYLVGDAEISWIAQDDVTPLLDAFPRLTGFTVRGGGSLRLAGLEHATLRALAIESGGLSGATVRDVASARLPALRHLELLLGDTYYGYDATLDDLAPILSGEAFPRLRYLGLRNASGTDDLVTALAGAPVTATVRTLDLSMGTLTDRGARVLLDTPVFHRLERLDLDHHYMSEAVQEEVRAAFTTSGVRIGVGDRQEIEELDPEDLAELDEDELSDYLYPAVGE